MTSETVTLDGPSSPSLSLTSKAMVLPDSWGCAEAWLWVGSMDLKSFPRKSLKYATVLSGFLTRKLFA